MNSTFRSLALAGASVLALCSIQTSSAGTLLYNNTINASNPVVHLGFDETSGTVAVNSGTSGINNFTYSAGVSLGQSTAGPALLTAASTSTAAGGLIATNSAFVGPSFTDYTFECWFSTTTLSGSRQDLFEYKVGGTDAGIFLNAGGTGRISYSSGSGPFITSGNNAIEANTFYLVNVVKSASTGTTSIYLTGGAYTSPTLIASAADATTLTGGTANVTIGRSAFPVNGTIDEFALYNSALSTSTIASHFAAAAVPEPAALSTVILGLGAMVGLRRFRRTEGRVS